MNADALIGKVLGTCTLQKIIGQGGMGAVYLAQQSRPRRQVAVKVLLPTTSLTAHQRAAFLERFRRETDAAASLEHPNILHVHEYGEQDGLAYLVVPYISGGTLREVLEQEGQLPLPKALNYLEQLASALDFAHERGIIHRDIKPANILITSDGRLLVTDFGLVKIIADGQPPQVRLTGAGAPVGTPDYMAPEQVIGDGVDGRSDLYSLGVILYQMTTGLTPFSGETPMQIAAHQLRTLPSSPLLLRKDLPIEAEQVILRALEKRPADRFSTTGEFAAAFREALTNAGIPLGGNTANIPAIDTGTAGRLFTPRSLFDPSWQQSASIPVPGNKPNASNPTGAMPAISLDGSRPSGLLSRAGAMPNVSVDVPRPSGLLSRTGMFPKVTGHLPAAPTNVAAQPKSTGGVSPTFTMIQPPSAFVGTTPTELNQESPVRTTTATTTGSLIIPNTDPNATSTMKLTGPVKVVQVPVAGQPGRFVTGLLPMVPQPEPLLLETTKKGKASYLGQKLILAVLALLIILGAGGSVWYLHGRTGTSKTNAGNTNTPVTGHPNLAGTATAQVQATVDANVILTDALSQNIHNFPISKNEFFQNNAYHIANTDGNAVAVVLAGQNFTIPNAYTLTMWEVKGDDASNNNSFGMIIRFSQQKKGTKTVTTFYSFEVVNINGGEYRFYKYDDSQGTPAKAWTELWHMPFGREYHQGQGTSKTNTIRIFQNGPNFTFSVNGKVIGNAHDGTLISGMVGMLVNLKGTEIAFSNMQITHK